MTRNKPNKEKRRPTTGDMFGSRRAWAVLAVVVPTLIALAALGVQIWTERKTEPALDLSVLAFSVYNNTVAVSDTLPPTQDSKRFNPWARAEVRVTNAGRQATTIVDFRLTALYRPLVRQASGFGYWVVDGTDKDARVHLQRSITIGAGETATINIVMPLYLMFNQSEREHFQNLLRADSSTKDFFERFVVRVREASGRTTVSPDFFANGVPLCQSSTLPGPHGLFCLSIDPDSAEPVYVRLRRLDLVLPHGLTDSGFDTQRYPTAR